MNEPGNASARIPASGLDRFLAARLGEALPGWLAALLSDAARLAAHNGWQLYLVGGYLRDVLLTIPDYDIDVSVVGDAPALATQLAEQTGARLEIHDAFGTATLLFPGQPVALDLVTARSETYAHPGALPGVKAGSIEDDLARRDFTINALAVELLAAGPGALLDPHRGIPDMQARLVRVLHARSFIDDPTRVLRAVKLAKRLGFKIERDTLELILQAVRDGVFATVSTERLVHEIMLVLGEPQAGEVLGELDRLGVLAAIHPGLYWPYPPGRFRPSGNGELTPEERRRANLAVIAAEYATGPSEAESLARDLKLPASDIALMRDAARLAALWPQLGEPDMPSSRVYALLKSLDPAAIRAYTRLPDLARDRLAWERLNLYEQQLRKVKPLLTGDYLRRLGVPPGPVYRQVLESLLNARLDGLVPERADEERFVQEQLRLRGWTGDQGT